MATKVKFYNGTRSRVDAKAVENGALYVATDTNELLADLSNERHVIGKQYTEATQSAGGLMSAADKKKLDGIASGAQVNTVTGVKGSAETSYRTGNVSITAANIGLGNVSNTADSAKSVASAAKLTTARTIGITGGATAAAVSFDGSANVSLAVSSLDATKLTGTVPLSSIPAAALERLVIVKDDAARLKLTATNVQNGDVVKVDKTGRMYFVSDDTKLGTENAFTVFTAGAAASVDWSGITNKPSTFTPAAHDHQYAGSATVGGSATSAVRLDTSTAGSATQPVYFSGGNPAACTYTLGASVPANAKFTDNDTWIPLKGATTAADGTAGYVPAPTKGEANRYLRSDGTWVVPPNTSYGLASASANGLMSSTHFSKLENIEAGANKYVHPTHTAKSSGLYKITVDSLGHVSAVTSVVKSDIVALGIPGSNTEYSTMTGASASADGKAGLVPAPLTGKQSSFLRGDGTWATPSFTDTNYYITGITWAAGTSAGPTATITRQGTTALTIKAFPSASASASGVITTGAQTIAGVKTFSSTITGSVSGNAGTATKFSSARSIALTGNVTGSASSNGESGWSISTTIADKAVTSAKLADSVGTVSVSATEPTDTHVMIWIKP